MSLVADAVYCTVAGIGMAVAAPRVGATLGVAPGLVRAAGVATVAWAGVVAASTRLEPWTRPTVAVSAPSNAISSSRYPLPVPEEVPPSKASLTWLAVTGVDRERSARA